MTPPHGSHSDDDLPPVHEVEDEVEPASSGPNRELLEQIVRRTLDEQQGGELPPALVTALHEIARRQRDQSQPWDTVVVELVEQVLESWFSGKMLTASLRRSMAVEIADVLVNDPVAGARLRNFWDQISEAAP